VSAQDDHPRARHPERVDPSAAGNGNPAPAIGLYLSGQRRLRGISLDELAERTKIPRRNIERLEAGAFDGVPDGFTRGFVRTVAQALGLDPDETVMRLMREPDPDDLGSGGLGRMGGLLLRFALAAALVIVVFGLLRFGSALIASHAADDGEQPGVVYRRDPVRALARSSLDQPTADSPDTAAQREGPSGSGGAPPDRAPDSEPTQSE